MIDNIEAYQNLANAIVKKAAEDYMAALKILKRNPDSEPAKREIRSLEKFFYSSWYMVLTDVDPGFLIRKMKEKIFEDEGGY